MNSPKNNQTVDALYSLELMPYQIINGIGILFETFGKKNCIKTL